MEDIALVDEATDSEDTKVEDEVFGKFPDPTNSLEIVIAPGPLQQVVSFLPQHHFSLELVPSQGVNSPATPPKNCHALISVNNFA